MSVSVISSTKQTHHIDLFVCGLKKPIYVKTSLFLYLKVCLSTHRMLFKIIFQKILCVLNSLIFSSFAPWVIPCLGIFKCNIVSESLKTSLGREAIIFSTIQFLVSGFLMVLMSDFWLFSKYNMLC